MKTYRFYYHYNKPASLSAGEPRLSVHFRDTCYIVKAIICGVPCESKINKRQPRCVMAGFAQNVKVGSTGTAYIT